MAVKSNIEIDVDSAAFLEFQAKFNKYADALKTVPDAWVKVGKSSEVAKSNFESVAPSVATVGTAFAAITKSGNEFYQVTTSTARHWKDLAATTGHVAKNIRACGIGKRLGDNPNQTR